MRGEQGREGNAPAKSRFPRTPQSKDPPAAGRPQLCALVQLAQVLVLEDGQDELLVLLEILLDELRRHLIGRGCRQRRGGGG